MLDPRINRVMIITSREDHIARGYLRAFEKLNIAGKIFDLRRANHWVDRYVFHHLNHWMHNFRFIPKGRNLFSDHRLSHRIYRSSALLQEYKSFKPELVFHIRSWSILPEVIAEIRESSRIFGWWIEGDHRFSEIYPYVDHYDKFYFFSTSCVEMARDKGSHNVGLLPHAIDASVFRAAGDTNEEFDWVFVGKWSRYRQTMVEQLSRVSMNCALYGPGWRAHNLNNGSLRTRIKGDNIWGNDLVSLYNRSKVVINITQWNEDGTPHAGMNLRVLEVLACGRCLLTDLTPDTRQMFVEGHHFEAYSGVDDVADKLINLLNDPAKRHLLARDGFELVCRDFSFDARVNALLADFGVLVRQDAVRT